MMMLRRFVWQALLVALGAVVCWWLVGRFGPWRAVGAWAAAMALGCVGAAMLLRTAPVGRVNWRNRLAGYFLPWGYLIGRGKLPGIVATSWVIWVVLVVAVALIASRAGAPAGIMVAASTSEGPVATDTGRPVVWSLLLFLSWTADVGGIVYLLGALARLDAQSQSARTLYKLLAILVVLIAVSVVLWLTSHAALALLVAGGPPFALGAFYGVFLFVMIVFGRNARWN